MSPEQSAKFNPDFFFLTCNGFFKNIACNKEAANKK